MAYSFFYVFARLWLALIILCFPRILFRIINYRQTYNPFIKILQYPPLPETLQEIKEQKKAIFSNGSLDILQPLAQYSGLDKYVDHVLTADEAKIYKPHPSSYTIILEKLGVNREEVLFVSSNSWDVAGAKSFGFHAAWVNRNNKPMDELNQKPDFMIDNLRGIMSFLQDTHRRSIIISGFFMIDSMNARTILRISAKVW